MKSHHLHFSFLLCLCISLCSEGHGLWLRHCCLLETMMTVIIMTIMLPLTVHFLRAHHCAVGSMGIVSPRNRSLAPNCLPHTTASDTITRLWCESTVGEMQLFKSIDNALVVITWKTWIKRGASFEWCTVEPPPCRVPALNYCLSSASPHRPTHTRLHHYQTSWFTPQIDPKRLYSVWIFPLGEWPKQN